MNRLIPTLAAALVGTGLVFAPAAFAQGMTKGDTMSKPGDTMGKGTMSKGDDKMGKGTMSKDDGMKKGEMGKKDEMKK